MMYIVDGKSMDLEKCEKCGAMKVVGKKCACEKTPSVSKEKGLEVDMDQTEEKSLKCACPYDSDASNGNPHPAFECPHDMSGFYIRGGDRMPLCMDCILPDDYQS